MSDFISTWWPVITAAVIVIMWLARIEGKVKEHDKAIGDIQESQEKSIDKLTEKLDRVDGKIEALGKEISRLAGYMERCQEEGK